MSTKFQNIDFDLNHLPPMPAVAAQIVNLINSPKSSASDLAKIIKQDSAVSARVLKLANSSFYNVSRQVTKISTAIVVLGERTLENLVLAASLKELNKSFGPVEKILWEDSMVCALCTQFLAKRLKLVDPEEAFLAGLFRHIGKIVINNQFIADKKEIMEKVATESESCAEFERKEFGATHEEVGAALLEAWHLSEEMSLVALHHHDEDLSFIKSARSRQLISVVNIANECVACSGILGSSRKPNFELVPGVKELGLGAELMLELHAEFSQILDDSKNALLV